MIALIILTVVGVIIEYLFTRERVTEEGFTAGEEEAPAAPPLKQQVSVFAMREWLRALPPGLR